MENCLVFIIVPCYYQSQFLSETLDSVLSQTYQNWECIIVNDGSPDNAEEVAQKYCKKDSRFKYFYKENGGISSARNFGIKNSIGEYILPLDGDDIITSNYVELSMSAFIQNPRLKIVYSGAYMFGVQKGKWILPEYNFERLLFQNLIFCSAVYKRCDYDLTKGYDLKMTFGFEDWEFWLQLLNKDSEVLKLKEYCFYYRIKDKSRTTELDDRKKREMTNIIFMNHNSLYNKYIKDIVWYKSLADQKCEENDYLLDQLKNIKNSKSYKLGKFIVKTFKILK